MSFLLACRFANVAVYLLLVAAYFVRSNDVWRSLSPGLKVKRLGIGAVFLVLAVGSANAYLDHLRPTWPVPCLTVAGALVLLGLWLARDQHDPHH